MRTRNVGSVVIACVVALIFTVFGIFFYQRDVNLRKHGVVTGGVVSELIVSNPGQTTESFRPMVRFTANGGDYEVLTSSSSQYAVNQAVQVRYLPSNPSIAEIEGSDALANTYFIIWVCAAIFWIVAIIFYFAFVRKNDPKPSIPEGQ